MITSKGYAIL